MLWSPAESAVPAPLVPTTALVRNPSCPRVLNLVRQVRGFFPELDGCSIRVGLTRSAAGFAAKEELCIWINPYRLSRHTIAHELVHLLQFRGLLPQGERSADLFALARHPVLADDVPCYLKVPRSLASSTGPARGRALGLLYGVAAEAVRRREEGHRTYLQWFEDELKRRWALVRVEVARKELPVQVGLF